MPYVLGLAGDFENSNVQAKSLQLFAVRAHHPVCSLSNFPGILYLCNVWYAKERYIPSYHLSLAICCRSHTPSGGLHSTQSMQGGAPGVTAAAVIMRRA